MLNSIINGELNAATFLLCSAVSLLLGVETALMSMFRSKSTAGFAVTVAVLPVVVQTVIMLVNGNLGAGVAVAGAFGLVRFRSAQGSAREIGSIFLAMALGLASGMGYLALAGILFALVSAVTLLLSALRFGERNAQERILRITIPENLDYDGLFDDLLDEYTASYMLDKVKTSGMGTLYELEYRITLKGNAAPKAFLDAVRCRNGNLNVSCGRENRSESL